MTARLLSIVPARVRQIVASYVGPQAHGAQLDDATRLDALRLDSLARMAIACDLDEAFHVEVPDDDIAEWQTLGCLSRTIARLTGVRA